MKNLIVLIILAFACSGISFTITVTSIFGVFREEVSKWGPKWDQLIHCPWCLSHYVILVFMLCDLDFFRITNSGVTNFLVFISSFFAVVTLSGMIHYVLLRAYEPVARTMALRKLEQIKAKKVNSQANGKVNL